jgi:hypothetical protein
VFCIYLRTNSDLCHLHHKLTGFYNRDEKCLLRGTNWVFKYSSLRFVFKGLNLCPTVARKLLFGVQEVGIERLQSEGEARFRSASGANSFSAAFFLMWFKKL